MPCQVVIETAAAGIFSYVDNAGVTNAMAFPVAGTYVLRMALNTINASTVTAVTVFWQPPLLNL